MKTLDFNTVKLWAVWSWSERRPGEFYFDDLDELVALCAEIGLFVAINIIPEGVPYWVTRKHPDARYVTHEGQALDVSGSANMPSGGTPGLCPDSASAMGLILNFIRTVVERYASEPHVLAFDVWNEPHIEPIFDYPDKLLCYCEHSKQQFIAWLKTRYTTLEDLNRVWTRAYAEWDDVLPPVRFGTYPDMMDWRRFWIENLGRWLEARVAAARPIANGKPLVTHVPFSGYIGGSGEGGLGYCLGDEFVLSRKVDKFGLTSFPKWLMQNDYVQHLINIEMVAAASGPHEFWQSELQAGAGKWEALGRPVAAPEEITLWNWSAIACGAKGVLYWQWRPEPSGMEAPGFGLTTIDGEPSPRTQAAADCARAFNAVPGFDQAHRVPACNGIYVSRNTDLFLHAAHNGEFLYTKGLYGAYKACFDAGLPVRMVHADHLTAAIDEGLSVLYMPVAFALSVTEQTGLLEFVERGGTLIAEACPGLFDDTGTLQSSWDFLDRVFGLSKQEIDAVDQVDILFEPDHVLTPEHSGFHGRYYRQDFLAQARDVAIIARFSDGRPAIFERVHDRGRAVLIGSLPSLAVAMDGDPAAANVIRRWMHTTGYAQLIAIDCVGTCLIRLQETDDQLFVVAANYASSEQEITLKLADRDQIRTVYDAIDPTPVTVADRQVTFTVNGQNGRIVSIEWPNSGTG